MQQRWAEWHSSSVRDPASQRKKKRLRVVPLIKELQEKWGILTFHERSARLRQISPLLPAGSVGQSWRSRVLRARTGS